MGWAVIQIVDPYHPAGDTNVPKTTEFVHWIFETQAEATGLRTDLLLSPKHTEENILIKQVETEAWTLANLTKKKGK